MMIDKVVKLFAPAAKDAKQALAPLLEQAKRGLEPVKGKAASAIESLSQHPFSRKVTTEFDNAIARATVIYAEVSGFTAVQQQRAVVQATEVELSDARQAFSEAESVLKSKRQSYEEAQLVATEEISAFNLNPDLPVHVKECVPSFKVSSFLLLCLCPCRFPFSSLSRCCVFPFLFDAPSIS